MFARIGSTLAAALVIAVAAGGCSGCNKGGSKSLKVTSPEDEAVITSNDDISAASGIQINVECAAKGFSKGDEIVLHVEDETGFTTPYSEPYDGSGKVKFASITFTPGSAADPAAYELKCTDRGRTVSSDVVAIGVSGDSACPSFTWIEPKAGFAWNAEDDDNRDLEDGFQHDVQVGIEVASGTTATLYLNDAISGSTSVQGGIAAFFDVDFPTTENIEIEVKVGTHCTSSITGTLDTGLPDCTITDPTGVQWINLSDDVDTMPGMQVRVVVTSADAATAKLFVDADPDEAPFATMDVAGGQAIFAIVPLADAALGMRCIQASCADAAGNTGFSARSCYGVDATPPTIEIAEPLAGDFFNDESDINDVRDGVQVNVEIETSLPDTSAEIWSAAACTGVPTPLVPEGTPTTDDEGNASGQASLGSADGVTSVCARIEEPSGNSATATVSVTLDSAAPGVKVVRPDGVIPGNPTTSTRGDSLILAADNEASSGTDCMYTVLVECELVGEEVKLYRAANASVPGSLLSTATCRTCTGTEITGAPACDSLLRGRATFLALGLAQTGISPEVLYATQEDTAGNIGKSSPASILIDTVPPVFTLFVPTCGTTLHLAPPYVSRVALTVGETGTSDVVLNVYDSTSTLVPGSPYTKTNTTGSVDFNNPSAGVVTFALGQNRIEACASDKYGQRGCNATCTVNVVNLPAVIFTAPTTGASLGRGDDKDGNPTNGFQYDISFTADVAAGSSTRLKVGTADVGTAPYAAGGVTYSSVTIAEGAAIQVMGCATDARGEGCTTITVSVDMTPPAAITDLAMTVLHRREGRVRLNWTAPGDGTATVAGYDIRCSPADITEGNFDAARAYTYAGTPAAPGAADTATIAGLQAGIGTNYRCAVKAMDRADNRGALSNVPAQPIVLQTTEIDGPAGSSDYFGVSLEPAGDVNGDTYEDFIAGSAQSRAIIYFGSATGISGTNTTTINGPTGIQFGASVCGIGNFDGDSNGYNDVAIGAFAANSLKGEVYIFLGRASWSPTVSSTSANMKIVMDDPSGTYDDNAWFGNKVRPAGDFNGDGKKDLIVTAQGWNAYLGTAFVILGRATLPPLLTVPGNGTDGFAGDFQLSPTVNTSDRFGSACDVVGLVSSDTLSDIVCAAPRNSLGGSVFFFYGRTTTGTSLTQITSASKRIDSPSTSVRFGQEVAGAGDVNGDTKPDLLVGATYYPGGNNHGALFVFLHGGTEIDSTADMRVDNGAVDPGSDLFGLYISRGLGLGFATVGKINTDERADILVGSAKYHTGSGTTFAFLGKETLPATTSTTAADLSIPYGVTPDPGGVTSRPSYIGDINKDGFADFAVGQPEHQTTLGRIVIFY